MKVDIKKIPQFKYLSVINADTNEVIPYVISADDETGEYVQYNLNNEGKPFLEDGELKRVTRKANIRFEDLSKKGKK